MLRRDNNLLFELFTPSILQRALPYSYYRLSSCRIYPITFRVDQNHTHLRLQDFEYIKPVQPFKK